MGYDLSRRALMDMNIHTNIKEVTSQTKQLQTQMIGVAKAAQFKFTGADDLLKIQKAALGVEEALFKAEDSLTGQLDLGKFNTALKKQGLSIGQVKNALTSMGAEGQAAFDNLTNEIARAEVPLKRTSAMMNEMRTSMVNTLRWNVASSAINKVVGEVQKAFNYTQKLDKSLNNIQIVTGHSAEYMKNFAIEANAAAKNLSASTLDYTNAALIYYQQGLSDKEVAARTETTIKMAQVTGETANKVSQQMTSIWNNFSTGIDNLERYADVMANLGANTASSSSEIAKGLEKFASVANTIGLSYDYAATAMATITAQTRQSADSVGTSLKTLFSRLESLNLGATLEDGVSLTKYSEALTKVGVNVLETNGKLRSMDNILSDLGERWKTLTSAQQVALAQTVGGVRNYTSLIALMDNWETFQENLITAQTAEGTLSKQAEIYASSWEAAQQRVQTSAQTIWQNTISSDFFKGLNNFTANILDFVGNFSQTLGSSGSVSMISAITGAIFRDKMATGIDNAIHNISRLTPSGRAAAYNQKFNLMSEFGENIRDSNGQIISGKNDLYDGLRTAADMYARTSFRNEYEKLEAGKQLDLLTEQTRYAQASLNTASQIKQDVATQAVSFIADNQKLWNTQVGEQLNQQIINTAQTYAGRKGMIDTFAPELRKLIGSYENEQTTTEQKQTATKDLLNRMKNYAQATPDNIAGKEDSKAMLGMVSNLEKAVVGNGQLLTTEAYKEFMQAGAAQQEQYNTEINNLVKAAVQKGDITLTKEEIQSLGLSPKDFNVSGKKNKAAVMKEAAKGNLDETTLSKSGQEKVQSAKEAKARPIVEQQLSATLESQRKINEANAHATAASGALATYTKDLGDKVRDGFQKLGLNNGPLRDSNGKLITKTGGEFAMDFGLMANSINATIQSFNNFKESLKEGTATFGGFTSVISSAMMSVSYTSKALQATQIGTNGIMKGLGAKLEAANLASLGTAEAGLTGAGLALGLGTLAAIGIIGYNTYSAYEAQTLESRTEYAKEYDVAAKAAAKESKQKYDALNPAINQQTQSYNQLQTLQLGSAQYTAQLIASNQQAMDLIDTYNLQAGSGYSIDSNGALFFTPEQAKAIDEQVLEQANQDTLGSRLSSSKVTQLEVARQLKPLESEQLQIETEIASNEQRIKEISDRATAGIFGNVRGLTESEQEYIDSYQKTNQEYQEQLIGIRSQITQLENTSLADYTGTLTQVFKNSQSQYKNNDLLIGMLSSSQKEAQAYREELANARDTNRKWSNGKLKDLPDLKDEYFKQYGELADDNWSAETIAAKLDQKSIETYLNNRVTEIISSWGSEAQVQNTLNTFAGYKNFTEEDISKITSQSQYGLNGPFKQLSDFVLQDRANAIDAVTNAVINNTNEAIINGRRGMAEALSNWSTNDINQLKTYVTHYGATFGKETGSYVYQSLFNKETGGFNRQFAESLYKLNATNSLTGLYSLQKQSNLLAGSNENLSKDLQGLQDAILKDIDNRGGLAKTLFGSADFQNVFSALQESISNGHKVTAENIADLAKKNETLNSYLKLNDDNYSAVATMATMVAEGQINAGQINTALENAVTISGQAEDAQQKGLELLKEQDLGTSYSETDKYYKVGGKAWYTAYTNDMLMDAPLMNFLNEILSVDELAKYNEVMNQAAHEGLNTKQAMARLETVLPNVYQALETWEGKKGKGGGGVDTMYALLAQNGVFDNEPAFGMNKETGRIEFGSDEEIQRWINEAVLTPKEIEQGINAAQTTTNMQAALEKTIYGDGTKYTKKQAQVFATQIMGSMSSSAIGNIMSQINLQEGANQYISDTIKDFGGVLLTDAADAYYNAYKSGFTDLYFDKASGKFVSKEDANFTGDFSKLTKISSENEYYQALKDAGLKLVDLDSGYLANHPDATFADIWGRVKENDKYNTINAKANDIPGIMQEIFGAMGYYQTDKEGNIDTSAWDFEKIRDFYSNNFNASEQDIIRLTQEAMDAEQVFTTQKTDRWGNVFYLSSAGQTAEDYIKEVNKQVDQVVSDTLMANYTNKAIEATDAYLDHNGEWSEEKIKEFNEKHGQGAYERIQKGGNYEDIINDLAINNYQNAQKKLNPQSTAEPIPGITKNNDGTWDVNGRLFNNQSEAQDYVDYLISGGNPEEYSTEEPKPVEISTPTKQPATVETSTVTTEPATTQTPIPGLQKNDNGWEVNGKYFQTQDEAQNYVDYLVNGGNPEEYQIEQTSTNLEDLSRSVIDKIGSSEQFKASGEENGMDYLTEHSGYLQEYSNMLDQAIANANGNDVTINGQTLTDTEAQQLSKDVHAILDGVTEQVEQGEVLQDSIDSGEASALTGETTEQQYNEQGYAIDENGNINLDLPRQDQQQQQQKQQSSTSGTNEASFQSGSSSSNLSQADTKAAGGAFIDAIKNGALGDSSLKTFTYGGNIYNINRTGDGIVTGFTAPDGTIVPIDEAAGNLALAAGQNNNLIPKFASGKEGTIAVTGELGPELHVKSDGSINLLGEHGREYAWIEPDDKIYTATQTASILGNKSLEELQGFSDGINNFIPGYGFGNTTSQEGPSSGGDFSIGDIVEDAVANAIDEAEQNHRYDANWLKYRDILERYYTILQQMENIAQQLSRFAELADRAWGEDRQKNMQEVIKLQEDQISAQKQYLTEIKSYLKEDAQAMTSSVQEFVKEWNALYPDSPLTFDEVQLDENGVITNYDDILKAMVDAYNMSATGSTSAHGLIGTGGITVAEQASGASQRTPFTTGIFTSDAALQQGVGGSIASVTQSIGNGTSALANIASSLKTIGGDVGQSVAALTGINYVNVEAQTMLEERLKDFQFYTQTLNLYEQEKIKLDQMYEQLFDTRLKSIQTEFEYKSTIKNNDLTWIDYQLSKIKDDAYQAAEAVSLIGQKQNINMDILKLYEKELKDIINLNLNGERGIENQSFNAQKLTDEKFQEFINNPESFFTWMTDLVQNPDFSNYTAAEIQALNQIYTATLSQMNTLKDNMMNQINYLGNTVKSYAKDMDTVFNKFDHYKNLYSDWQNIIDLTGRSVTKLSHDLIVELNSKVVDNAINKLSSAKKQFDTLLQSQQIAQQIFDDAQAQGLDRETINTFKENLDKVNKEVEEAEDAYMKSWEDALQTMSTAFQAAIKDAVAGFEENFSPIYNTLDALSQALDRERTLRDLYLRPYDQAHDLSKLNRDIQSSILDTDNLRSKRELKKLLDDINDTQEDGVQLSAYDLDIMQKKYDLELARAALEDAKNAKSLVRLARDNNGNWSYVYSANEDDVDEAEQRYEDAILAMEQANEDYIDNLQDQLLSVWRNAEAEISALNPADFESRADYDARVQQIVDAANQQIKFIQEQMNNALDNNNYILDNVSGKATNIIKDLTTAFDNTTLAMLTGTNTIDNLAGLSIDNIANLAEEASKAYDEIWNRNADAWKTAGHDITDAASSLQNAMNDISSQSIKTMDKMVEVADEATDAFSQLNKELAEQVAYFENLYNVITRYEAVARSNKDLIKFSGNYLSPERSTDEEKPWIVENTGAQDNNTQNNAPASTNSSTPMFVYNTIIDKLKPQFLDSGGYTGEWANGSEHNNGRFALLHQKELVLNAHDTENFLDAMEIVRQLDNFTNWMANGLGSLIPSIAETKQEAIQQEVHITAEFPNATNHFEIEEAFNNLNNLASQYVNRK